MPELYLRLLDRILTPVLLVLAVVLLMVGHNAPGGGFIAGLVVATAFLMQIISRGDRFVRALIGRYLQPVMGIGLGVAVLAALVGLLEGGFFKGVWWAVGRGRFTLEIGTPMIFDMGVFLVVAAVVTSYILELSRQEEEPTQ
jgi:multisubunit Na+/H+ antiporter MnhB subunit